ncbi:IS1096 element passenger TnpR family protein [Ureibacillus sp. MALMAid1270]|uniref:IS1096 element passenger TnpR family protein n=1 Tax=Ureibacillus sp. MALMAid1270 TaxID=3411629 RepID=UPI003BA5137D
MTTNNTNDYRITIVKDFDCFLHYFQNKAVKLTKTNEYMTRTDLLALYELMSEPKLMVHEKSNQPAYPILHLFFILGLELKLLQKTSTGSGIKATVNEQRLGVYRSLTPSEQYVTLLECFWLKADWDELQGGYHRRGPDNVDFLFETLSAYPIDTKIEISQEKDLEDMLYRYNHFLFYFELFGLWKVEIDDEMTNRLSVNYHGAKSLILTPLFLEIEHVLRDTFEFREDMKALYESFEMDGEVEQDSDKPDLFELLQHRFSEGQLVNRLDDETQAVIIGEHVFKVSLNKSCWRTMQLNESHNLLDFHLLIQRAFDFNDDHLYAFYMDGKKFGKKGYYSTMDVQGPFVNEIKIGELQLFVGQKFLYLFDFGEEWEFTIEVVRVTEGKSGSQAAILDSKGESPNQYDF